MARDPRGSRLGHPFIAVLGSGRTGTEVVLFFSPVITALRFVSHSMTFCSLGCRSKTVPGSPGYSFNFRLIASSDSSNNKYIDLWYELQ